MKLDQETRDMLKEGDAIRGMVEGDGWKLAKDMLYERIAILDSVSSLPNNLSFEEIGKQAMYRQHAINLVEQWVADVEARVEQHRQQISVVAQIATDSIVRQHNPSA